jgi:hypothetical protein
MTVYRFKKWIFDDGGWVAVIDRGGGSVGEYTREELARWSADPNCPASMRGAIDAANAAWDDRPAAVGDNEELE